MLETAQSIALTPAPLLISGEQGSGKSLLVQFVLEKARFQKTLHRWGRDLNSLQDGDAILVENISELNLIQQQDLSERMDEMKQQGRRVRWIATCSENPAGLVQQQRLRKDLFYRLSVIHLQIPTLRDRSEDILVLADFFSQVFNLMKSRPHQKISPVAQAKLLAYGWPGNVSELENVIERAVALSEAPVLEESVIEFSQMEAQVLPTVGTKLSDMERKLIFQTLQLTQQNKTRAAQILGISIRTLRNKLNEYREAGVYEPDVR
jgi:two-component system response regulator FlrC